jgi:uroporphyrinogen-III synthase
MILVTRPEPEAGSTIALLHAMGKQSLWEPMLVIDPIKTQPKIDSFQVAFFTSGNGVKFVAGDIVEAQPQVLVVGDATANLAKARGFKNVLSAGGNVDDLYELALKVLCPQTDKLIHFCGKTRYGDLVSRLVNQGFDAEERLVYRTRARRTLTKKTKNYLQQGDVRSALFFSPRTATVFMKNLNKYGLTHVVSHMTAFCISPAVAEQLQKFGWGKIVVAKYPTQNALLDLINSEDR